MSRETTMSFVQRLAARLHTTAQDLIAEFFASGNRRPMSSFPRGGGEVYFNTEARARLAALTQVPATHLERALPAWSQLEPAGRHDAGPALTFYSASSIAPTATACARCTAARTGRTEPARLYTAAHQRVCRRHAAWLTDPHDAAVGGGGLSLVGLPEIAAAHRRHATWQRRRPGLADAFPLAQAITATWWDAAWPQEKRWPQLGEALARANPHADIPERTARAVATYPDSVALAGLLASGFWQQQIRAQKHKPHTPADSPDFTGELAARLRRPWLVQALADESSGPLTAWLHNCWRPRPARKGRPGSLWWVAPAYRAPSTAPARRTAPHSSTAPAAGGSTNPVAEDDTTVRGFARGYALAEAFAQEHGHLSIPYRHRRDGFQLGLWLSNQRAYGPRLPPERSRALAALDPWWNPPWSTQWQRIYQRAHRQVQAGTLIDPGQGFDAFSENMGSWLFDQCLRYQDLHPQQRALLARIGITSNSAEAARRRQRSVEDSQSEGLAHAGGYAANTGHLCAYPEDTHDGFPIGQWLSNQRSRTRAGTEAAGIADRLAALDPWWAAPWPTNWQRSCYTVGTLVRAGQALDPANAFTGFDDAVGQWLFTQCATYQDLAPGQQQQLSALGLTAEVAATARPNPATRVPSLETGLYYARSYAHRHGGLDIAPRARHDGFPLGTWLARQRHYADTRAAASTTPWPGAALLAALDPWWNPPWGADWNKSYRAARDQAAGDLGLDPEHGFPDTPDWTGRWLHAQYLAYPGLHPEQHRLLALLGITAERARVAKPRRTTQQESFNTGLDHARAQVRRHGHLTPSSTTRIDGYPIGSWLATQRERAAAGRLPADRTAALAALDPCWNPPWRVRWQTTFHAVKTETAGLVLDPAQGFAGLPASVTRWLFTQCAAYRTLHQGQQQQLAGLGITAQHADALRPQHEPRPRTGPGAERPRPATIPSGIDAGLPYARAYAHQHGGLGDAHYEVEHDGFPLGWWLNGQRKRANAHVRRTGRPWPHQAAMTALDPWWNPPWRASWQHTYTRIRIHPDPAALLPHQQRWITQQLTNWHNLHPDQQALLTNLGLTPAEKGYRRLNRGEPQPREKRSALCTYPDTLRYADAGGSR
ncbi:MULTISPECIES: helicase associated domain-containing protein [unclassified Kitasatospora]|uniref:helicase associated domain-containing protein n=1 Tax=unclassified Kitasatospora TaxID=2633591 RepID=UPI00380E63E0